MAEEARAGDRTPDATTMSGEAWEHVKACARTYRSSGQQLHMTNADLYVLNSLALKALPRFGHTYAAGYARLAEEFATTEPTVRYHCQRLEQAGLIEISRRCGHTLLISFPGLDAGQDTNRDNRSDNRTHRKGLRFNRNRQSQRARRKPQSSRTLSTHKSPKRLENGGVHATPPAAPPAPDGA